MSFEWDKKKSAANRKKHGIAFDVVPSCFDGPMLVAEDTREDYGEPRYIGIGFIGNAVVVIVFTERGDKIRIVSARKALKHEREKFKEFLG